MVVWAVSRLQWPCGRNSKAHLSMRLALIDRLRAGEENQPVIDRAAAGHGRNWDVITIEIFHASSILTMWMRRRRLGWLRKTWSNHENALLHHRKRALPHEPWDWSNTDWGQVGGSATNTMFNEKPCILSSVTANMDLTTISDWSKNRETKSEPLVRIMGVTLEVYRENWAKLAIKHQTWNFNIESKLANSPNKSTTMGVAPAIDDKDWIKLRRNDRINGRSQSNTQQNFFKLYGHSLNSPNHGWSNLKLELQTKQLGLFAETRVPFNED